METETVQCPSCWQLFDVPSPGDGERPCEVDYDCFVCCRPLVIHFPSDGEAFTSSLADS
ncbi:MAG: CPXCG motif-containing cysteine-rich protein [Verrucomicrobiota bacterium JB023]|nr:CPXCG motif-containing cysteine-rich protein [Verrucomicrobiota bacterium JB023]